MGLMPTTAAGADLAPTSTSDLNDALRKVHVASVDLPVSKLECR
jgi:hypothetical protein